MSLDLKGAAIGWDGLVDIGSCWIELRAFRSCGALGVSSCGMYLREGFAAGKGRLTRASVSEQGSPQRTSALLLDESFANATRSRRTTTQVPCIHPPPYVPYHTCQTPGLGWDHRRTLPPSPTKPPPRAIYPGARTGSDTVGQRKMSPSAGTAVELLPTSLGGILSRKRGESSCGSRRSHHGVPAM